MAFLEGITKSWLPNSLMAIAVGVAAPVVFPVVGSVLRVLTKELIRGGLCLIDVVEEVLAETRQPVDPLKDLSLSHVAAPPSLSAGIEMKILKVAEGFGEKALEVVEEEIVENAVEVAVTALV